MVSWCWEVCAVQDVFGHASGCCCGVQQPMSSSFTYRATPFNSFWRWLCAFCYFELVQQGAVVLADPAHTVDALISGGTLPDVGSQCSDMLKFWCFALLAVSRLLEVPACLTCPMQMQL
jgi:hypothetical protein